MSILKREVHLPGLSFRNHLLIGCGAGLIGALLMNLLLLSVFGNPMHRVTLLTVRTAIEKTPVFATDVLPETVNVERNVATFIVKDLATGTVIARVVPSHPTWVELSDAPDGRARLRWLDGLLGQSMDLSPDWYVAYQYEPTIVNLH